MNKIIFVVLLSTVLQGTYCSPVKRNWDIGMEDVLNWENEMKGKGLILNDTNPEYRDGPDIVEGDIKLTPIQAAIFKESGWDGLVKSESWEIGHKKWPRYVPYEIASDINEDVKKDLSRSMKALEQFTCLRFIKKEFYDTDYIKFVNKPGCSSRIGRQGGAQEITLSSECTDFRPAHDILHALGRLHEQSRADRDDYVEIIRDNIISDMYHNFEKYTLDNQNMPYDYLSIMHYENTAFNKARGLITIKPRNNKEKMFGQRQTLSMYDIVHTNVRYCPERSVRLVGGKSGIRDGRVEVFWNMQWGTVCNDGFDLTDAKVTCKYLGFPGVEEFYNTATTYGEGTGPVWMEGMDCKGEEHGPFSCKMKPIGKSQCKHNRDVGIKCKANVRFAGQRSRPSGGRVEVFVNGEWGTICDDSFGREEAKVICRQLGYGTKMATAWGGARYGHGEGKILMDTLQCTGTEQQITHCLGRPIGKNDCTHSEDVAVTCV